MRKKLTKNLCDNVYPKDRRQLIYDSEVIGLILMVGPRRSDNTCNKSWYYSYRPKGSVPTKLYLAPYPSFSVAAARLRAKQIQSDILKKLDPTLIKQKLKAEFRLYELIEEFYRVQIGEYKPKTQETMRSTLNCWVLQQSSKPELNQYFTSGIKFKKISTITLKDIIDLHKSIGIKSKYSANRTVEYLRTVFNWAIAEKHTTNQPVQFTKKKGDKNKGKWFDEKPNNKIFTENEREYLLSKCFVKDERSGQLNYDYYIKSGLNIVSCLAIAWCILTGRRQKSEGFCIKFDQINLNTKTIHFDDTKTGAAEYKLGPRAIDLIKTINKSKLKTIRYPEKVYGKKIVPEKIVPGPWAVNPGDYVFPGPNKQHIQEVRKTWKKLLDACSIDYLPLKQCRHTFGTLLLSKTGNLSAVQGALGHTNATTTQRYAKILQKDVSAALDVFDKVETNEADILKFKK